MAFTHNYAILQLRPFAHRNELINIGIIVFHDEKLDVRLSASPSLIKYFGIQPDTLDWTVEQLRQLDDQKASLEDRIKRVHGFAGVHLENTGWFIVDAPEDYEIRVASLLSQFVEKPKIKKVTVKKSKLSQEISSVFRDYKIFSSKSEDLERHKVVANMPIGPAGKLKVDFLLKNGSFHATETLDFRQSEQSGPSEVKNAALANVTFRHAREAYQVYGTKCYLVYAAPAVIEKALAPAISIATDDADDVFNLESKEDKVRYFDRMLAAAGNRSLFN